MAQGSLNPILHYLRRLSGGRETGQLSDAQLLERFVTQRDEAAFEVLVWRYGPLVLGVCRRVLLREQDAEDAFQATFLALVRKAAAIGKGASVGSWLYKVAYRVALRARKRSAKQTACVPLPDDVPAPDTRHEVLWRELRPILDEEVSRLPRKYREAVVLCYLEGKTNAEAARLLGCPRGTVVSRLAWARERLRVRLARRGVAVSAGLLAWLVAARATALPPALVSATLKTVLPVGAVSAEIAGLTEGVLRAMFLSKLTTMVGVLALSLGGGGLGVWYLKAAPPEQTAPSTLPRSEPVERERAGLDLTQTLPPAQPEALRSGGWTERATLQTPGIRLWCVAFSPDGKWVATGGEARGDQAGEMRLWDVATGRVAVRSQTAGSFRYLSFSPDGKFLATAELDDTVRLRDPLTSQVRTTFKGHKGPVNAVAFAPDARILASASWDKTVRLWDVAGKGQLRILEGHSGEVYSVAFSPDGRSLVTGSQDHTAGIWDIATGRAQRVLRGHADVVETVAFSPDAKLVATGSWDQTVRLWDAASGKQIRQLSGHTAQVLAVVFSPDGRLLASASGGWGNAAVPNNTPAPGEVIVWDIATGRVVATLKGHRDRIFGLAFSPDGRLLATASWDGTIKLWQSGPAVRALPKGKGDRLDQLLHDLLKSSRTNEQIIEAIYLATLARLPAPGEQRHILSHLATKKDRAAAFEDVLWALTNSKEFSANVEALGQRDPRREGRKPINVIPRRTDAPVPDPAIIGR
jgi:RNA polymerase sigma factor (sigma-70 family)